MPDHFDLLHLILLALVLVAGVAAAVPGLQARRRAVREQAGNDAVRDAIIEYFRRSGVTVAAACMRLPGSSRLTAVIESEPMKRFRLSHIIEMTLRDHVRKTCGLELDKVYWRFPIKEATQATHASEAEGKEPNGDDYINEGLEHYKYIPKMEATELSWEHFEQATATVQPAKPEGGPADDAQK
ncbi:hypothetical protein SAMN06265795_10125 [Noviherbaspirillum humi]|uniref:Uncharacterized protein n=2 Tax=Noviherbaspirillum humi TaxID=1688639 RepID=A0A239BRC4_9BURK|nr:hypothetical protein SAMN06265795_10125 [Noviherbaspirillum humi]